jgi:hypothetical protein
MNLVEAFRRHGAQLNNARWSVSAFAEDGSLVVCLWEHFLKPTADPGTGARTLQYSDQLSTWAGNRNHGAKELKGHLERAMGERAPLRLVITHTLNVADRALIGQVTDEGAIPKDFSVREDLVGEVAQFNGDAMRLVFRKKS